MGPGDYRCTWDVKPRGEGGAGGVKRAEQRKLGLWRGKKSQLTWSVEEKGWTNLGELVEVRGY